MIHLVDPVLELLINVLNARMGSISTTQNARNVLKDMMEVVLAETAKRKIRDHL